MQNIGLMGGSFNPIHCGHIHLARAAIESGLVDRVLFLPTGNPPHKRSGLADKMDRLAMTELAVAGEALMGVCREEVERGGVIYTVDTLTILKEKMPDCRLIYLIGADTLCTLHTWRRPEDVVRLCTLLVAMRPGEDMTAVEESAKIWRERGAEIVFLSAEPMNVSSTEIRSRMQEGKTLDGLVPPQVEAYMRAHRLYESDGGAAI